MDWKLLESLKEKRKEIALREGKELFRVFQNKVLEETAEAMPKSRKDLEGIKGWGKKKIQMYGDEFLAVVNSGQLSLGLGSRVASGEKKAAKAVEEVKILSVQEFLLFMNERFASLGSLQVRGEITEVSLRENYGFFTIKDSQSQDHSVSCFIGRVGLVSFGYLLEEGMEVVVNAVASLYKNGRFSLTVQKVEAYGEGALKKALVTLMAKLEGKGYFDATRKRPIPEFVKKIGLITSESGAAIRDFLKNLGQYGFEVSLVDVRVEGDYAELSIISTINWLNKYLPDLDVLVLIRGGGSLENLKAFNSESLAEAIVMSRLPIITGVGHEKDVSIADLASDMTLSTPTAVANFLRAQRESLLENIRQITYDLNSAMENILETENREVAERQESLVSVYGEIMHLWKYRLNNATVQMQSGLDKIFVKFRLLEQSFIHSFYKQQAAIKDQSHSVQTAAREIVTIFSSKFQKSLEKLKISEAALTQLNPEAVLKKGYSIVYTAGKKVLNEASDVKRGEKLNIKLFKGEITSSVE